MTHPVGVVGEQIVHLGAEGAGGLVGQRPEQRQHLLFAAVVPRQRIATGHVPDDVVGEQFTEPNQVAGGEGRVTVLQQGEIVGGHCRLP